MEANEIYFAGDFFIGQDSKVTDFQNLFKFSGKIPLLINLEGMFVEEKFKKDKYTLCRELLSPFNDIN